MSIYAEKQYDSSGIFQLVKRVGQVEMWHNPDSGSYEVVVYEHIQQDEDTLLAKTVYSREKADYIFDTVVSIL